MTCGASQDQGPEDKLFEVFAKQWFNDYVIANNKYSEQRTKKYLLRAHLVPFFGRLRIGQITAHHIEQFKSQQVRRGASNKAIKNQLTVLNKCLNPRRGTLPIPCKTGARLGWDRYSRSLQDAHQIA
jgi:hypothetical protein